MNLCRFFYEKNAAKLKFWVSDPKRAIMKLKHHVKFFFKLICKPCIKEFLLMDQCCAIVDKYILVGVFIYFLRANFEAKDYTTRNFYIALYLCHEIHEEVDILKFRIVEKCLGNCITKLDCLQKFHTDRIVLLKRINFNVYYSVEHCEMIFSRFPHVVWYRIRTEDHYGVINDENTSCYTCLLPIVSNK